MVKTQFSHPHHTLSYKRLIAAGIALVVFFLLLTSVIGLAEKYFAIQKRTREIKNQQVVLEEKERVLTEQNAYLQTVDGQQQSLRAKFNVVNPGEEMIVITMPPDPAPLPAPEQSRIGGWWESLIRGLGFKKE